MKPTSARVRELFDYDDNTGLLTRKLTTSTNAVAGSVVGWINSEGYLNVKVDKKSYKVHQIIWLHVYGQWQLGVIDHINQDKTDNRISNLQDTTVQVNNINKGIRADSKTGIPNVTWRERDKLFYAACRRDGRQNYIGSFKLLSDAENAVSKFKEEIGRTK